MTRLNIVHLDSDSIGPDITMNRPACEHRWTSYAHSEEDDIVSRLGGADIAIVNKIGLDAETIGRLPALRMIAVSATGYDRIDVNACIERGIVVSNVRGYASNTVPEHTFALILSLRRGLKGYQSDVLEGKWQQSRQFCLFTQPVGDLHGSTLGLIGSGAIGGAVGRIAEAFGMRVIRAARKGTGDVPAGYTSFDQVIEQSDVISLHCPLTPETAGLIGAPEFARMKKNAILINTSRGGLVHEHDLIDALDRGSIAGAAFDVVSSEPPPQDHIFLRHLERPNFILTPHVGWSSHDARQALWYQLIGHIDSFADGQPSNNVCEG
ncbi:MAG: D-2-hydroxyacid dehydrogenase [Pseudomonadota bacterium]|nr:D-2-hydroxyacid dehydrogenase [Pseudomonadota bacterium]